MPCAARFTFAFCNTAHKYTHREKQLRPHCSSASRESGIPKTLGADRNSFPPKKTPFRTVLKLKSVLSIVMPHGLAGALGPEKSERNGKRWKGEGMQL
eukprot:1041316-Rhodomonas_salina.1